MKIGEKYEITSDKYQWILTECLDGKDKDGNPKTHTRDSYHGTIEQCCETIVQRDAKQAETLMCVVNAIYLSSLAIEDACKGITKEMVK